MPWLIIKTSHVFVVEQELSFLNNFDKVILKIFPACRDKLCKGCFPSSMAPLSKISNDFLQSSTASFEFQDKNL